MLVVVLVVFLVISWSAKEPIRTKSKGGGEDDTPSMKKKGKERESKGNYRKLTFLEQECAISSQHCILRGIYATRTWCTALR